MTDQPAPDALSRALPDDSMQLLRFWRSDIADALVKAFANSAARIEQLQALLDHAEQYARDLQDSAGPVTLTTRPLTEEEVAEWEALFTESMRGSVTVLPAPVEIRTREWGVHLGLGTAETWVVRNEHEARTFAAMDERRTAVSRLVGPWEPAEQPGGAA